MGPGVEELGFMRLEHFNTNTGRQLDSPISTSLWPRVRPIHRGSLRLLAEGRGFERHFRANGFLSLKFPAERAANGVRSTTLARKWRAMPQSSPKANRADLLAVGAEIRAEIPTFSHLNRNGSPRD